MAVPFVPPTDFSGVVVLMGGNLDRSVVVVVVVDVVVVRALALGAARAFSRMRLPNCASSSFHVSLVALLSF